MPKPIAIPARLVTLLADEQRLRDALELLNAVAQFQTVLEVSAGNNSLARGRISLTGDPPNLTLRLPFRATEAIADPLANTAANTAAIIAILGHLRTIGFLPA